MSDMHKHRCGYHLPTELRSRGDPPAIEQGCGFEWEHERVFKSPEDYARRHMCPHCGVGPWYARLLSDEEERLQAVFFSSVVLTQKQASDLLHGRLEVLDEIELKQGR